MQPMAQRVADHQRLSPFVVSSNRDVTRARVARWAEGFVAQQARVVGDNGFVKDGVDSPRCGPAVLRCVGQGGHCQIGIRRAAVTDWACAAMDWRLLSARRLG
jgi:hypothetical protein